MLASRAIKRILRTTFRVFLGRNCKSLSKSWLNVRDFSIPYDLRTLDVFLIAAFSRCFVYRIQTTLMTRQNHHGNLSPTGSGFWWVYALFALSINFTLSANTFCTLRTEDVLFSVYSAYSTCASERPRFRLLRRYKEHWKSFPLKKSLAGNLVSRSKRLLMHQCSKKFSHQGNRICMEIFL